MTHVRIHYLRFRHCDLERRRKNSIQHWVNINQQEVVDNGVVYHITKKLYPRVIVSVQDRPNWSLRPLVGRVPYAEPRVRVFDPTLLVCHVLHDELLRSNESVELDLPF